MLPALPLILPSKGYSIRNYLDRVLNEHQLVAVSLMEINGIHTHIARENASSSRWTAHHRLYDRYFFKGNGMDEEQEMECLSDPEPEREPPAEVRPEVRPPEKKENPAFSNQPLKALENLDLFK